MSPPASGNYYILNAVTSMLQPLAINFNGQDAPLTVTPFVKGQSSQIWNINHFDNTTQTVSPMDNEQLLAAFGDYFITTLPGLYFYTWTISGNGYVYTIQDGAKTVYWDLNEASPNEEVTYNPEDDKLTDFWFLYPAGDMKQKPSE